MSIEFVVGGLVGGGLGGVAGYLLAQPAAPAAPPGHVDMLNRIKVSTPSRQLAPKLLFLGREAVNFGAEYPEYNVIYPKSLWAFLWVKDNEIMDVGAVVDLWGPVISPPNPKWPPRWFSVEAARVDAGEIRVSVDDILRFTFPKVGGTAPIQGFSGYAYISYNLETGAPAQLGKYRITG